jgi:hypothetical protein
MQQAPAINGRAVSATWLRPAVVYFVLGVALGIGMGVSGNHALYGVHAHLNLLGWASLALMGLIYGSWPQLGSNWLARTHFWMHNIGLPAMMIGLTGKFTGHAELEPGLYAGAVIVGLSVVLFAINVLAGTRRTAQ